MFLLHSKVMISDCLLSQPIVSNQGRLIFLNELVQCRLEQFVLYQYNRKHGVLMSVIMAIELAQHRTDVEMRVS